MDKETQQYFKQVLLKRLDELYSEAEKTVAGMTDNEENFPDPTDRATLESDRNFTLRIRDRERKLILKIREALQRIGKVISASATNVVTISGSIGLTLGRSPLCA